LWLFVFSGTGAWTQGLPLEPLHRSNFFVIRFFEIGSHKLFAWVGFELWSSWVARIIGVSHWCSARGGFERLLFCNKKIFKSSVYLTSLMIWVVLWPKTEISIEHIQEKY
jgi:hypothetical protein